MRLGTSKRKWLVAMLGVAARGSLSFGACGLNWAIPSNHFDGVSERGVVSYWEQIDTLDLGRDLKLPLIVNFRSDRAVASPFLGSGWGFPLLESNISQIDERNFLMVQPDGFNRYFHRKDSSDPLLKDDGGWAARVEGPVITAWAECGWKLTFVEGRLTDIQTPDNRKLSFLREGGRVTEIREGGATVFKVLTDPLSSTVVGWESDHRRVGIEMGVRPLIQNLAGKNVVAGKVPSVARFTGTRTASREYRYGVDRELHPTMEVRNSPARTLAWDPRTRLIISDGDWNYTVQPGPNAWTNAAIRRRNTRGQEEFWHYDRKNGQEIEQGIDGVRRVSRYFVGGPLIGKLRKVEETAGNTTRVVRDLAYDEHGRLFREINGAGEIVNFEYDAEGRVVKIRRNGELFASRVYDGQNRLLTEKVVGADRISYRYLPNGGYEKVVLDRDGGKASFTYDRTDRLLDGVLGDSQTLAAVGIKASKAIEEPGKREVAIAELKAQLDKAAANPQVRGDRLIALARLYLDDTLGPVDAAAALQTCESILEDPAMDAYTRGQVYSWISCLQIEKGRAGRDEARKAVERLLALKAEGLPGDRRKGLAAEQKEGFRRLLALMETGEPASDEARWRETLHRYGDSAEFRKQFDDALLAQKQALSTSYFNNP